MFDSIKKSIQRIFETIKLMSSGIGTKEFKTFEDFFDEMQPLTIRKLSLHDLYIWGDRYDQKPNFLHSPYAKTAKNGRKYFDVPLNKVPEGYPQTREIKFKRVSSSTKPEKFHSPMIGIRSLTSEDDDRIFFGNLDQVLRRRRLEHEISERYDKFFH